MTARASSHKQLEALINRAAAAFDAHRMAREHEATLLDDRDRAIADAVRAGARLEEIAEAASVTRAAISLAARRTLAARPGRGGPYLRRRGTAHALNAVSVAAHDLAEARKQSRQSRDRRDKAIATAVTSGAGVSETARAIGMTPASVSVIARSGTRGDATNSTNGAFASR